MVDSNVILDILTEDPIWYTWSEQQLIRCMTLGTLVINPIIYAEVSISFATADEAEQVLNQGFFRFDPLPYKAAFVAGKAFSAYRRRGGDRRSPLPDFYIGAHALAARLSLLTRDANRYQTYFPGLELISP